MALTDKVEKLQAAVIILEEQNKRSEQTLAKAEAVNTALSERVTELEKTVALLEQKSAMRLDALDSWKSDTKKRDEEWARRAWSFGPNLVAGILTVLLSVLIAWLMSRRP